MVISFQKIFGLSIVWMRVALAIIFIWFGLLKLSGNNPVYEIVHASFPFLADGTGNYVLAIFETLIGFGLLFDLFHKTTHIFLLLHLLGTFGVFVFAPEIAFDPYFPFLTLAGEFVLKNIALAVGGLIVLSAPAPIKLKSLARRSK